MPTFEYIALDSRGKETRGNLAAESPAAARRQLRGRELHATKITPISESSAGRRSFTQGVLFQGRRKRMLLEFTRQLGTMINAEVQLTEALAVMISQTTDPSFKQVIQNVRDELLSGESFTNALREHHQWFDPIYVSMIRVGEVTGNLARSMGLLTTYMSKRQKLESKLRSALTYPAILIIVAVLVTIVLMTFVVPRITQIIMKTGQEIPLITRVLIGISDAMTQYWWLFLMAIMVGGWLLRRALATKKGRLAVDRFVLKLPVLGELIRQTLVARFTSTLAALIRSGMPVADGLQVVAEVTGSALMAQAIQGARERIIAGADIATPLRNSGVIGPAVAHMIAVGERSGELETMLVTIAESLEENTDLTVQRMSAVVEPLIIVVMAVVVGFIVIATLLPILQVANIDAMM